MLDRKHPSALSRSVSGFANALAGIGTLLAVPKLTTYLRPEIYRYFLGEFPQDISLWASWGFIALMGLCVFFGLSFVFQFCVQWLLHHLVRRTSSY